LDRALRENPLRIVLIGFGTVGQSFARVLTNDRDWLVKNYGFEPQVTAIVDSRGSCRDDNGLKLDLALKMKEKYGTVQKYPGSGERKTTTRQIISETEAEAVVETTPSNFENGEPGLTNIKQSLSARRHVVTANKGPLALAMPALLELANHTRMQLRFSATVGAGTPFLTFASKCLPGEKILGIRGVLNGTTNYILTRMDEASLSFQKALAEAQEKGYAEKSPANDLKGLDTAAKIVIIANWVLKHRISINELEIIGIQNITPEKIRMAKKSGARIKLIGRLTDSQAVVKPEEVPAADPLCVLGNLNALSFSTEHIGDVTLIGRGAGGEETASAIIRDLVDIRSEYSI
jgi:homoserine dehydrogenase